MLKNESGFTLLEVIIALAIMTIGFTAILSIQSGAIKGSARAKQANVVAMLAKNLMVQSEFLVEGKPFTEVKAEESAAFPEPFQDYAWKREIKEIEFPELDLSSLAKGGESSEESDDSAQSPQSNDQLSMIAKIITKFLSKAIREIRITISWKSGKETQTFTLTNYWVNLNNDIELTP